MEANNTKILWSALINELRAILADAKTIGTARKKGTAYLSSLGLVGGVWGTGNSKVGLPATYRPVGLTCPSSCAALDVYCYAQRGRTAMAQRRAVNGSDSDAAAFALAMVCAEVLGIEAVRLHVSGDFVREDRLDLPYIMAVAEIAAAVPTVFVWAYTHASANTIRPLLPATVQCWQSDVVFVERWHNDCATDLIKRTKGQVFCPEQRTNGAVTCATCGLCWRKESTTKRTIVFQQH